MPNIIYSMMTEKQCRDCHGESLADRHHDTPMALDGKCGKCHEGNIIPGERPFSHEKDCKKCHIANPHHQTESAKKLECVNCHKIGVSPYNTGKPLYKSSLVTPTKQVCNRCHGKSQSGDNDNYPVKLTHHETGIKDCGVCHSDNKSDPDIRLCERCHSPQVIHRVMVHINKQACVSCHRK